MTPSDIERMKELLPTELGSDEIREQIAADILRRSVFSARMASATYLAKIREVCAQILDGTIDQASARNVLEGVLEQMGHYMSDDGGLRNPASIRRLNLIVETQTKMAASVNELLQQTPATMAAWPAWVKMNADEETLPESLILPAMDYLRFSICIRQNLPANESRTKAYENAVQTFRDIRSGQFVPESDAVEDDSRDVAGSPAHGTPKPSRLLD